MPHKSVRIEADRPMIDYLYQWEQAIPDQLMFRQPFGATYKDFTWKEGAQQVRKLAAYLKAQNFPAKSHIGLLSKNCAEWMITDLAIMMAGHVSVPFYPTLTAAQLNLVVTHSDSVLMIVGKLDNWNAMKPGIPAEIPCISFPSYNPDPAHVQWDDIMLEYSPMTENPLPAPDDLMTIIYTSGTTGNPKGVMLSYRNFSSMLFAVKSVMRTDTLNSRFFSYLPLCHIAERAYLMNGGLAMGTTFYFAESLESFGRNIADARPTHVGSVPRIWVKFQQGILAKMPEAKLNRLLRIPIISSLVKKKIRQNLGMNDAVVIVVGAAPMPVILLQWFRRLGVHIQDIYGMTENTGCTSAMPHNQIKDGTVGKIHGHGQTVRIDPETGEICQQAPWNMLGYYKEPAATAQAIDSEGWLHTGDVGVIDKDGFLSITGRVKEMYKTSKGEYVAPAQIELRFAENSFIEQVCVVGQSLPQPLALVVPSESARQLDKSAIIESLSTTLNQINPLLKPYERITSIVVMREPWTVENDMFTPTLKLKRNVIERVNAPFLEQWSEQQSNVIWLD